MSNVRKTLGVAACPLLLLALGCLNNDDATAPAAVAGPDDHGAGGHGVGFSWGTATPESQGMCGTTLQLGCTRTLLDIWTTISNPKHNTMRFIVHPERQGDLRPRAARWPTRPTPRTRACWARRRWCTR